MNNYNGINGKVNDLGSGLASDSGGGNLRTRELRRVSSDSLLVGSHRILIEHGEMEYFLSITRQGKLILTK